MMSQHPDPAYEDEGGPADKASRERDRYSVYRQLSGSEIRLIKLKPGSWDEPITCELSQVPLDDQTKYVALSYAWGDPKETRAITLDGKVFHITTNLFQCLRRLRYNYEILSNFIMCDIASLRLWADAICINQEDEEEKIRQITLMRDVYTLADRVYAWLGENTEEELELVFKILRTACVVDKIEDYQTWMAYLGNTFNSSKDEFESFAQGIVNLSRRPWFSRIWVIQEVALPSRSPTLMAGGAWIPMAALIKIVSAIISYLSNDWTALVGWDALVQCILLHIIRSEYQADTKKQHSLVAASSKQGDRLDNTLGWTQGRFRATLPHDYIYGLLGLVDAPALSPSLIPDYNKPYAQVYKEYARFTIENTGKLSILPRADSKLSGLPSWVPDFRSQNPLWENFNETSRRILFTEDGNQMILLGLELCVCTDAYFPPYGWRFDFDATFLAEIRHFDSFLSKVAEIKHRSKDETLEDWLKSKKEWNRHEVSITELKADYYSIVGSVGNEIQVYQNLRASHIEEIGRSIHIFTTFVTEYGTLGRLLREDRYAQLGDVLVVLEGTASPVLLRPKGTMNGYEYLGHCHYKVFKYTPDIFSNQVLKEFTIV